MKSLTTLALAFSLTLKLAGSAHAAASPAQKCESAIDVALGKYAVCRLKAEASNARKANPTKLSTALAKCSTTLSFAFTTATDKYGSANCPSEPSSKFEAYLTQCSNDGVAAVAGGTLPDHAAENSALTEKLEASRRVAGELVASVLPEIASVLDVIGDLKAARATAAALPTPPADLIATIDQQITSSSAAIAVLSADMAAHTVCPEVGGGCLFFVFDTEEEAMAYMQTLMNSLSQLSEIGASQISAANAAIASLARPINR